MVSEGGIPPQVVARAVKGGYDASISCRCHSFGASRPRLNPWDGFQVEIGTVTSRFLCFSETALSRRKHPIRLPKGASYSPALAMKMVEADAAIGFDIPVPDGANFLEVSMPSAVMRAYQQARQAHPNAANLPPMRIVERDTVEHSIALLQGGVIFVKEDPLQG